MDISRPVVEKPRFIHVEKFVESRTNSIAQLLKAIDNDALVSGEVTKGPRTAAQRLPRHMRRRAMAYDIRRFPRTMREFAASHLISKHAKKCPSRFARRKNANSKSVMGRSASGKGRWLSTHVWHAKRFRMIQKWGFKIADRSFQRGFRAVLRDSNKNCTIRDRSYYTCITIKSEEAYSKLSPFSQNSCRGQSSRGEEEECHQLYVPGKYPFGYIGPARFQRLTGDLEVNVWIHPSSKPQLLQSILEHYQLKKKEGSETEEYVSQNLAVSVDSQNLSRFHLSGPRCLQKLRDSVSLVDQENFQQEHERFINVSDCVFSANRDGEVLYLLIEDPRTAWDRKTKLMNKRKRSEVKLEDNWRKNHAPCNGFWDAELREKAAASRMSDKEYQKQNALKIEGVISTEAKVPLTVIIRNQGLKALDGIDLLVPEPFSKDLWVALQRRGVRASGLRDEYAAHLESKTLCFPIDDVESEAGRAAEVALKEELTKKYLGKPHNRRCKFWSALSVKYPFEFQWDELMKNWNEKTSEKGAFVCRDLVKLREISENLKRGAGTTMEDGALVSVRLKFAGRGRPMRFGMICLPTTEDLISIRRNRNEKIIQKPRTSSDEPMECDEPENDKKELNPLQGFVSLDAAASEKPIDLKWLFEESPRLDDKAMKRKRANKKIKESRKRRKLEFGKRKEEEADEEKERDTEMYRFSADREIIGRLVAGEQSVLGGRGVAIGYICADSLRLIASNYHSTKTLVMVRNSTSKYYHPAYLSVMTDSFQI